MWGTLIALLQTSLQIVNQWLALQTVKTQLEIKKLLYDTDQAQIAAGDEIRKKIDAVSTGAGLSAVELYLDDQVNAVLLAAGERPALPDGPPDGTSLGIGSGVPAPATPDRGPDPSSQPVESPVSAKPIVVLPVAPYAITGLGTWFGWNPPSSEHPDGSDDLGDVDSKGHDLLGAFGDDCHANHGALIGLSIPIPIFHATFGSVSTAYADVRRRRYLFDVIAHPTGKHATGVWLVDLGPNASLNRPIDMTAGLARLLGLSDNAICTWWVTDTDTGKILEIKGWNFTTGKNIS